MPGATPIYGLPYPTMNDPIAASTFCQLAEAIDALMVGTNNLINARTQARATRLDAVAAQNVAANVETALAWQPANPPLDPAPAMWSAGAPTIVTIAVAGVYLIHATATALGGSPADTGTRLSVLHNGNRRFSEKRRATSVSSNTPAMSIVGMLPCLVGDTLDVRLHWQGAGGPTTTISGGLWHLTLVVPL